MKAFLFRVSTMRQVNEDTIETQKMYAKKYITKNNITSYKFYEDAGISGRKGREERKGLDDLLTDIEEGLINEVWFYSQSRLTRSDELQVAKLVDIFKKNRITLYFNDTGRTVDLNNKQDKLLFRIQSAVDANELDTIQERMNDGKIRANNEGRKVLANIYGYKKTFRRNEDGLWNWEPEEEKLALVEKMFNYIASGMNVSQAYKKLEINEFLKCGQNTLNYWYSRLRRMEYTGYYFNNDGVLVESKVYTKKVISVEKFETVQKQLAINKGFHAKTKLDGKYTGTGLLHCFYCNAGYYSKYFNDRNNRRYNYYSHIIARRNNCKSVLTIKKEKFETILYYIYMKEYIGRLFNINVNERRMQHFLGYKIDNEIKASEGLDDEIKKLKERWNNIDDLMIENGTNKKYLREQKEINIKLKELRFKKEQLTKTVEEQSKNFKEYIQYRSIKKLKDFLNSSTIEQNAELRKFLKKGLVKDYYIYLLNRFYIAYKISIKDMTKQKYKEIFDYVEYVKDTINNNKRVEKIGNLIEEKTLEMYEKYDIRLIKEDEIKEVFVMEADNIIEAIDFRFEKFEDI